MLALGHVIAGRYRVCVPLGRGGMADVHRGDDLVTGEPVAIKLLRVSPTTERWSGREVRALERLDDPTIVRLRASGIDGDVPYLVLDYVDGEPLSVTLARGALAAPTAVALMAQVADGVAHAHARGIVHRDIKPANILLDRSGRPHLADFGIARLADATATTGAGFLVGTASYLAPEQVRGERVGPAADVYALGLVLLECLTGERAYPGTFNEAAAAHLERDPIIPAGVAPPLARIVRSATARNPAHRPSAGGIAHALRQPAVDVDRADETVAFATAAETQALPVAPAPVPVPQRGRSRRAVVAAIVVGGAVGIAGGLAVAHARDGSDSPTVVTTVASTAAETAPPTSAVTSVTSATTAPRTTVAAPTSKPKPGKGHGKD